MKLDAISLTADGPVAHIRFSRPESGNPIDLRLLRELEEAAEWINGTESILVTVIESAGETFSKGRAPDVIEAGPATVDAFASIASIRKPVIAAIDGEAASGGLELALACDIRIASTRATFSMPETAEGRIPIGGGSQRLPRLIGRGRALSMLLLGEVLDAEAAYRAGLVSAVVPPDELAAKAEAAASSIAARGPIAERYAKEALQRGLDMTLEQAMRYETDLTVILQTTADRAEGVKAFLEKRSPKFKNE
jgi:enoyl-CoA hydratase